MQRYCNKCKKMVKVWKFAKLPSVKHGMRQRYIGTRCGHTMY